MQKQTYNIQQSTVTFIYLFIQQLRVNGWEPHAKCDDINSFIHLIWLIDWELILGMNNFLLVHLPLCWPISIRAV